MNLKLYLLFCALWIATGASAQKNKSDAPDKNIERYLKNGKAKNCYNLIQFRVAPAVSGYMGLSYERKLTRIFSLEGGLYTKIGSRGVYEKERMPTYQNEVLKFVRKYNGGVGILLYPKLNIGRRSLNDVISVGFRVVKQFSSADLKYPDPAINTTYKSQLEHSNYFFMIGNHRNIFSNFTLGMDLGYGVYSDKYKQVKYYDDNFNQIRTGDKVYSSWALYLDMSLGYLF